jgi:hypothetical protein
MFVWHTVRGLDGRVETVDGWEALDALIAEMAVSSWEEPGNGWASYVTDDATGEVVAVAIFGPGLELLVTVADGRQLRYPVPEFYREHGIGCQPEGDAKGAAL